MPGPAPTYATNRDRQAAYRRRRAERDQLVDQLLHAVRNARLDSDLHAHAQHSDDNELLAALVRHYHARHWQREGP